jgi:hypothetical protein
MSFKPTVARIRVDSGEEEWRLRWGKAYPVVLLGEPGWQFDLPGKETWIEESHVRERKDVVVLGERSCGIRDFLSWCCGVLGKAPWMFFYGATWLPSLAKVSDAAKPLEEDAFQALEEMSKAGGADRKADALIRWAGELRTDFHLIIRDFSELGEEDSRELAQAFRLIRDSQRCPRLHILAGSSSESYLTDTLFSSFLPMTYRYRMRPLQEEDIRLLLYRVFDKDVSVAEDALKRLEDLLGGQPFLIQRLLRRIAEGRGGRTEIDVKDVEGAFRLEKRSPPSVVQSWQRDLAAILKAHPELREPMRSYVAGATLGLGGHPPNDSERPLFVAGWLRARSDNRWGIASELHATLARTVLDAT